MTRDDLLTLSQRLREYNHNPHHINPVSDAFHKLITESAEALSQFAAIQGGMGEANKHGAQPEVAENTGSLNTEQTPIGVETVCLSVDGVAAPDEAELADDTRQARAAQPAPVVPEGFKALLDRIVPRLDAGGPNPIDPEIHHCEWTLYQERERIHAEFAAAPAQGQQVEWRTTAVMLEQANAGLAQLNGKLRAELAALKAQQVGQEPQRCQCCGYLVTESEHRGCLRAAAPQPAPAQDVAGWIPVTERLPEVETDVLVRGVRRNEVMHRVAGLFNGEWSSQETEDLLLGEVTHWMPLPAAPAAHDKQSGGEV